MVYLVVSSPTGTAAQPRLFGACRSGSRATSGVVPRPVHRAHPTNPGLVRRALIAVLCAAGAATAGAATGCASAHGAAAAAQTRSMPSRPGSGLSGQRVVVLPLSAIRGGDALGWAAGIASPRDCLADANAQIARALPNRAPHTSWILPADLAHAAARNPGYAPDPYGVDVSQLMPDRWKPGEEVADPLASQLRSMLSFTDARLALVPVEIRFFPRAPAPGAAPVDVGPSTRGAEVGGAPTGRAVLRVALVDTRRFVVVWAGDLAGDPAPAVTPAMMAALADRLADAMATP